MRVGEKIWHCRIRKIKNAEIPLFEKPQEYTTRLHDITVQPSGSAYRDLVAYGENISKYRTIIAQPYQKWYQVFHEGDRLYIDGKIPTEADMDDIGAENANYEVETVDDQSEAICVMLKKRTAE